MAFVTTLRNLLAAVVGGCSGWHAAVVARYEKTLAQVLGGAADANVDFEDLRNLLIKIGAASARAGAITSSGGLVSKR